MWAHGDDVRPGAVSVCLFADPEAPAVGVDGLQVDGAAGVGGDEAEGGGWLFLEGRGREGIGGGEEGEEGSEDEGGVH